MVKNKEKPEDWYIEMVEPTPNLEEGLTVQSARNKFFKTPEEGKKLPIDIPQVYPQSTTALEAESRKTESPRQWNLPWLNWQIGSILIVVLSGSLGYTAMSALLKLPATPDCHKLFLPFSSASTRLSCAQLAAETGTVEGIIEAIQLVEYLPEEHPLNQQINLLVAEWSVDLLKYGEEQFQAGDLQGAISTANQVPQHVDAYQLVANKIKRWESVWLEAEKSYQAAENHLRSSKWNLAFREAVRLTYMGNKYWSTVKYQDMVANINQGRKDSEKLDKAYISMRKGGVDNLLKAIEIAKVINSKSFAYQEASDLINKAGEKLLDIAYKAVDSKNWTLVAKAANALPASLKAQDKADNLNYISNAGSRAEMGTVSSLESAILEAAKIDEKSPIYGNAQRLIGRWKLEIEDVTYLAQARDLANAGTTSNLRDAISKADLIPRNNPRYQEAQREIRNWRRQIQLAEDQPILERAVQLARYEGSVASLQDAVNEASRISSGRPLYQEAQSKITQWNKSIERQQDQPFLNQAERLANSGNLIAAIEAAQRIQPGRFLYGEAQSKIGGWRREVQARQNLQNAYRTASARTPAALAQAISAARRVPDNTSVSRERNQAINEWSYQMLNGAQSLANSSRLKEAIKVAKMIPSGTAAYRTAQTRIRNWRAILAPPVIVPAPPQPTYRYQDDTPIPAAPTPPSPVREINNSNVVPTRIELINPDE